MGNKKSKKLNYDAYGSDEIDIKLVEEFNPKPGKETIKIGYEKFKFKYKVKVEKDDVIKYIDVRFKKDHVFPTATLLGCDDYCSNSRKTYNQLCYDKGKNQFYVEKWESYSDSGVTTHVYVDEDGIVQGEVKRKQRKIDNKKFEVVRVI